MPEMRASLPSLLTAAGFAVRGGRFNCRCDGGSRYTGSFDESKGVAYCHRCHLSLTTRQLGREQRLAIPSRRIGRARIMRQRFREWLDTQTKEMSNRERLLARRAEWAKAALTFFPEMESAWSTLAEWYRSRRVLEVFWESARDKVGRYWLYRNWRKYSC
jgi:hypothetical protein